MLLFSSLNFIIEIVVRLMKKLKRQKLMANLTAVLDRWICD